MNFSLSFRFEDSNKKIKEGLQVSFCYSNFHFSHNQSKSIGKLEVNMKTVWLLISTENKSAVCCLTWGLLLVVKLQGGGRV